MKAEEKKSARTKAPLWAALSALVSIPAAFLLAEGWSYTVFLVSFDSVFMAIAPMIALAFFIGYAALSAVAGGFSAMAFRERPTAVYAHAAPLLAYGSALGFLYLLCRKWMPIEALPAIAFYLIGFLTARAKGTGKRKTTTVLYGSVPLFLLILLTVALRALTLSGFHATFFTDYLETVRDRLSLCAEKTAMITAAFFRSTPGMTDLYINRQILPAGAADSEVVKLFTDMYTTLYVSAAAMLPAMTAALCNVCSYAGVCLAEAGRTEKKKGTWRLTASGAGIATFLISALINALLATFGIGGVLSVIASSLMTVYYPLMFALGVRALTRVNKQAIREHRFMAILLLIFIIMSPLFMISIIGAYAEASRKAIRKLKNAGPGLPPGINPGAVGRDGFFDLSDEDDPEEESDGQGPEDGR